jgi:hypothetical protein
MRLPVPFCAFSPTRFSDGPDTFDFVQGDNLGPLPIPFLIIYIYLQKSVLGACQGLHDAVACQYPKPILLNTVRDFSVVGYAHKPYEWSPSTVDVQIFRVATYFFGAYPKIGDLHADWELSYADYSWCVCWATLLLSGLNAAL